MKMLPVLALLEYVSAAISILYRYSCVLERCFTAEAFPSEDTKIEGQNYRQQPSRQGGLSPILKEIALLIMNLVTWSLYKAHRGSLALRSYFGRPSIESEVLKHKELVASRTSTVASEVILDSTLEQAIATGMTALADHEEVEGRPYDLDPVLTVDMGA